jgi:hypothetical protein
VSSSADVANIRWTFRPCQPRPDEVLALAGSRIYATGHMGQDGQAQIVLQDGTRVNATATEIVPEPIDSIERLG